MLKFREICPNVPFLLFLQNSSIDRSQPLPFPSRPSPVCQLARNDSRVSMNRFQDKRRFIYLDFRFIAILFRLNSQNWNLGTKSIDSHSGPCCEAPNQRRSRRKLPWAPRYRRIECIAQNIGAIQFRFYSTDFRVNSSFQDNTFKCHPSDPYWFLGLPKALPMVSKPHPTGKETIRHQISVFIQKLVPFLLSEL